MATPVEIVLKGRDEASRAINGVGRAIGGLQAVARVATVAIAGLTVAAGAVTAAGAAAFKVAGGFKDTVERLDRLAKAAGVTIPQLQVLESVFADIGLAPEAASKGLQKLARAIGENDPLLQQLGITTRDTFEAFLQLTDKLSRSADSPNNLAIAYKLLGKSAGESIGELTNLGERVDVAGRRMERAGAIIGDVAADKARRLDDALTRMSITMEGVKNVAGEALTPAVSQLAETFATTFEENSDRIKRFGQDVSDMASAAVPLLLSVAEKVAGIARSLVDLAKSSPVRVVVEVLVKGAEQRDNLIRWYDEQIEKLRGLTRGTKEYEQQRRRLLEGPEPGPKPSPFGPSRLPTFAAPPFEPILPATGAPAGVQGPPVPAGFKFEPSPPLPTRTGGGPTLDIRLAEREVADAEAKAFARLLRIREVARTLHLDSLAEAERLVGALEEAERQAKATKLEAEVKVALDAQAARELPGALSRLAADAATAADPLVPRVALDPATLRAQFEAALPADLEAEVQLRPVVDPEAARQAAVRAVQRGGITPGAPPEPPGQGPVETPFGTMTPVPIEQLREWDATVRAGADSVRGLGEAANDVNLQWQVAAQQMTSSASLIDAAYGITISSIEAGFSGLGGKMVEDMRNSANVIVRTVGNMVDQILAELARIAAFRIGGAIIGGIVGFLTGGPAGIVPGARAGAGIGGSIGGKKGAEQATEEGAGAPPAGGPQPRRRPSATEAGPVEVTITQPQPVRVEAVAPEAVGVEAIAPAPVQAEVVPPEPVRVPVLPPEPVRVPVVPPEPVRVEAIAPDPVLVAAMMRPAPAIAAPPRASIPFGVRGQPIDLAPFKELVNRIARLVAERPVDHSGQRVVEQLRMTNRLLAQRERPSDRRTFILQGINSRDIAMSLTQPGGEMRRAQDEVRVAGSY